MKKTKIVATIGPSSIDKIKELDKYVDVYRINFSHGDKKSHEEYFKIIRENSEKPILVDLPGPKLRIGNLKEKILLKPGDKIIFSQDEGIPVEDPLFYKVVKENTEIYLDDGNIKVHIDKIDNNRVEGTVLDGGMLTSRKGINIPDINLDSGVTQRDLELLKEALDLGADFIGVSFVLSKEDIIKVKEIVKNKAWVIAKIETKKALNDLENIIKVSDGVMVARGDLGVDIGFQNLIFAQKRIIKISRLYGKPVILATQVLESMVNNTVPTRAEIIDASVSVLEGVDAIMLSDETAIGNYPIDSVKILEEIILNVEKELKPELLPPNNIDDSIAAGAVSTSEFDNDIKLIVAHSRTGNSIISVSRLRPKQIIIGITPNKKLYRKLYLLYGVYPELEGAESKDILDIINNSKVIAKKYINNGYILILGGDPKSEIGRTDFIKIEKI
ncbi:pyruvate kinase [Candidatus Nanobsidianus stetteri]|uniref:Pyruvate kinase n=1 Tax=Nanobsidianus stetteri TaxID=1294122 RepID=R1E3N9_NANST|nr:pyruvate kinase [Candidatus Nanobsidianus stetteri]